MQRARALIGKHVLVGIAYLASDGKTETGQMQFHGIVRAADSKRGIALECHGKLPGETRILPPDTRYFCEAPPGTYRLASSGEVVANPDFTANWSVVATKDCD